MQRYAKNKGVKEIFPRFEGHRRRLRERFLAAGSGALHDYELLELILFRAIPRRDVKPLAKELLNRFGSFAAVLSAPPDLLKEVKGVTGAVCAEFKIVQASALRLAQSSLEGKRQVMSSWKDLVAYCRAAMAHEAREQFRVLFLDKKNGLIADEVLQQGTVDFTPVYPREVVKRALDLSASSIILVHNHPSGDPTPSRADIDITKEIVAAASALKIAVHDHVVIGREGHASLRALRLL